MIIFIILPHVYTNYLPMIPRKQGRKVKKYFCPQKWVCKIKKITLRPHFQGRKVKFLLYVPAFGES